MQAAPSALLSPAPAWPLPGQHWCEQEKKASLRRVCLKGGRRGDNEGLTVTQCVTGAKERSLHASTEGFVALLVCVFPWELCSSALGSSSRTILQEL